MKFSPKGANILFAVIMVGTMTFIITGVNTFVNAGFSIRLSAWIHNWIFAYVVALPIMMLLSPPLRKIIAKYTKK
ncbi:MAG TPA: DUF2798 domain-containing protein [Fibrobacteres bacterium]|jgi:hypothetical protein|nr:DUF2798 domain-containing protein [Fibrobacterota bacterium]